MYGRRSSRDFSYRSPSYDKYGGGLGGHSYGGLASLHVGVSTKSGSSRSILAGSLCACQLFILLQLVPAER
ncbi:hypothetical protein RRG08_053061 [Elysia crispata]|uniref:Uncharacterized protein n=1 Tax=Elysia crispata TaxID=231223 RepID=A0AAE1CLN3_9GAST|nr:hypothetical protein RRG08_053061 [Elysia crispata]